MKIKLISSLTALSLIALSPQISANAATKAGGVCSKAGLTSVVSSKTYTCIKSGKKLVWDKGVAISKSVNQVVDQVPPVALPPTEPPNGAEVPP